MRTKVFRVSLGAAAPAKPAFDPAGGDGFTPPAGNRGTVPVKDQTPEGGLLVGLEMGMGDRIILALRPIYRTAKGEEVKGAQFGTNVKESSTRSLT